MAGNLKAWIEPSSIEAPHHLAKRRRRKEDWEPYKRLIVDLRKKGDTVERIHTALKEKGFIVDKTSLTRKLRQWEPKNKARFVVKVEKIRLKVGSGRTELPAVFHKSVLLDSNSRLQSCEGLDEVIPGIPTQVDMTGGEDIEMIDRDTNMFDLPGDSLDEGGDDIELNVAMMLLRLKIGLVEGDEKELVVEILGEEKSLETEECVAERLKLSSAPKAVGLEEANPTTPIQKQHQLSLPEYFGRSSSQSRRLSTVHLAVTREQHDFQELMAVVEDMENWWVADGISSHLELHEVVLNDVRQAVTLFEDTDLGNRLAPVLDIVDSAFGRNSPHSNNDWIGEIPRCLQVLYELGQHTIMAWYFLGYFFYRIALQMQEQSHHGGAQDYFNVSHSAFQIGRLESFPEWARSTYLDNALMVYRYRSHTMEPPSYGLDGSLSDRASTFDRTDENGSHILLRELEKVASNFDSGVKVSVILEISLRKFCAGRFEYLHIFERLLERLHSVAGRSDLRVVNVLNALIYCYMVLDEGNKAIRMITQWFVDYESSRPTQMEIDLLSELAYCLTRYRERYADARAIYKYIIEQQSKISNTRPMSSLEHLVALGTNLFADGQYGAAIRMFGQVVQSYDSQRTTSSPTATVVDMNEPFNRTYVTIYLRAKYLVALTLEARGLVFYAQPVVADLVQRQIQYYDDGMNNAKTWEAIVLQREIDWKVEMLESPTGLWPTSV